MVFAKLSLSFREALQRGGNHRRLVKTMSTDVLIKLHSSITSAGWSVGYLEHFLFTLTTTMYDARKEETTGSGLNDNLNEHKHKTFFQ